VPIEAVQAVITVKTSLTRPQLRDALKSIESVRRLPRRAAVVREGNLTFRIPEDKVLRPRAYVFAFKSQLKSPADAKKAFVDAATPITDSFRPNGLCVLDQTCVIRRAYKLDTIVYAEHALMHFFVALVRTMDNRPSYTVDLARYFDEDYDVKSAVSGSSAGTAGVE
jgi:hypothetical protein